MLACTSKLVRAIDNYKPQQKDWRVIFMLSLKEKMEEYNLNERQVCIILDNHMYNERLDKRISNEVDNLTESIRITDKKICGYKKMIEEGVEYYEAGVILSNIEALEEQKEEYILKQSTLVTVLNQFRVNERGVI